MKHFVDTSVLRPIISSSSKSKEYYKNTLSGDLYYCDYVKMEFIRGFLLPAMSFYSTLNMPSIHNISDALSLWSQNFNIRNIKAVMSLVSSMFSTHNLDLNSLKDKKMASFILADYIRKVYSSLPNRFKDIGTEKQMCKKTKHKLDFDPDDISTSFIKYIENFNKKDNYKTCGLNMFLNKNKEQIDAISSNAKLKIKNSSKVGFSDIINLLSQKSDEKETYTCRDCSKIGDLIIGLMSPSTMRLEHTDYSFDYIMTILEKKHERHPSEIKIHKE